LNAIAPRRRLEELKSAFKEQLVVCNDLRHTQVVLAEISETLQELPQLRESEHHLQGVEKNLLKGFRKQIKEIDLLDISRRIRRMWKSLQAESSANGELDPRVLKAAEEAYRVARQPQRWMIAAQASTIHLPWEL
jgi:hypothetical protein